MERLKVLREQAAAIVAEMEKMLDDPANDPARGGKWSKELQVEYDAKGKQVDALNARIANVHRLNEATVATQTREAEAEGEARIKREHGGDVRAALREWIRKDAPSNAVQQQVFNALTAGTDSEGGYTIQEEVATMVTDALQAFGGVRMSRATQISTATGSSIEYPTSNGTSEKGERISETASAGDQDITFGTRELGAYLYSSKVVTVSLILLDDSVVDIEGLVIRRLTDRVGRITNEEFTTGTGSSQPQGIVTGAGNAKVTGAAGATQTVSYDNLVDLQHSVDPAYRMRGAEWMMHDSTVAALRKIKDDDGRPIFVPGYERGNPEGAPDRLLGAPIIINQQMPVPAANARSILFGDFSPFIIRTVTGSMGLVRYSDSAFDRKNTRGFLLRMRASSALIDIGGPYAAYAHAGA